MANHYLDIKISAQEAEQIARQLFGLDAEATPMAGEIDFNFRLKATDGHRYALKVSRPDADTAYLDFQSAILTHLGDKNPDFAFPRMAVKGLHIYTDAQGRERKVRLLHWLDGALYSSVAYKSPQLRSELGQCCGDVTACLLDFEHPYADRIFEWDVAHSLWTEAHMHLFSDEEAEIVRFFAGRFRALEGTYQNLRRSVIHNDANDNNIVVAPNDVREGAGGQPSGGCEARSKANPEGHRPPTDKEAGTPKNIISLIDYGDAVRSQTINDLAVTLAYAMMDCVQPLDAACDVVSGYHERLPLLDDELRVLYVATAMRLVISVTKSAINKRLEPDNVYLLISEEQAWRLLRQWRHVPELLAYYSFRAACGMEACPTKAAFERYAAATQWHLTDLFPACAPLSSQSVDLSVGSLFVGNFEDVMGDALTEKMDAMLARGGFFMGGYGEPRPIYTTDAYRIALNEGYEHRTLHLGVDFWLHHSHMVHAVEDGVIVTCHDNDRLKDYGPTIIIRHEVGDAVFFTLYGHMSSESLVGKHVGQRVRKGACLGPLGTSAENGGWASHLHFQVILDMLDCETDFYGVASPGRWSVFSSICPDPNLVFRLPVLARKTLPDMDAQLTFRRAHLGKSLSLSYQRPLRIVRGKMQYLLDDLGQQYLDTVNNVAHVGHEHPDVVRAGQQQMAVLNTNTRYLHPEILAFAEELLAHFPPELSVVHVVNSGSEANELALRMARTATGERDVLALEVGYHGNTQGCIDVSSYKFNGKGGSGCPPHTHLVPLPDAFRGRYRGADSGPTYAVHVGELIAGVHAQGRGVAAFLHERIVSCGGQVVLPDGFLKEAYRQVREAGGVCIADEVQTGFGRVGSAFWAFELHGVIPDIVTLGKPIGNGHPLAAVVCTRAVADAFANGMEYFNTFGGNPVSCAIGRSVLRVIRQDGLQENALRVGNHLKNALRSLQTKYPILADIRGDGLFLGIELTDAELHPLADETDFIANRMKDFRILMSTDGPDHNVLKIKPPMCFSISDADYLVASLGHCLAELCG